MSIKKVIQFADFNWFYDKYKPRSPYGLDAKNRARLISDANELNHIYGLTDVMIDFIHKNENSALKTEYHLSRIDRLNTLDKDTFDAVDLFLIKKLLIHYKAIESYLPQQWSHALHTPFCSDDLLKQLTPDQDFSESFHISSAFNKELSDLRQQIKRLDKQLSTIFQQTIREINIKYKLDFTYREFILVDKSKLEELDNQHVLIELYDSEMLKVKPVLPAAYTKALMEKEQLLIQESEEEIKVLQQLSEAVHQERNKLIAYLKAIEHVDVYLAKARITIQLQLRRPTISNTKVTHVSQGCFLPLQEKQELLNMSYVPLTAEFETNTTLLSGSNMGGKTVLFKTLAFLQLLTQHGFFVPALKYRTRLYKAIYILDAAEDNKVEGLSSFGQEIYNLTQALQSTESPLLLFADELAKTTNATEAKAIIWGVLNTVAKQVHITGFFSTHFVNIPQIKQVTKHRMKGLNRREFEKYCHDSSTKSIEDKIKLINSFMQYEVELDDGNTTNSDALSIARLLGLNQEIINYANDFLGKTI